MNRFEVIKFSTPDELAHEVAKLWLQELAQSASAKRPHFVALSGGRITLRFFAEVIRQSFAFQFSWRDVHFFWADERCVPPSDPESSYGAAHAHFFQPLGLAAEQIHRIRGEWPPQQAAVQAETEITRFAPRDAAGQPVFDWVFLGMGEDGHVASLFPRETEAERANPAIYRVVENSPKPPPIRVTLGYPVIGAAKQVWVLASGTGKEAALQESLAPTGRTPLAHVLQQRAHTRVFTDIPTV
ncbi:MAG TPA: 6-phosphogluconolactonase [Verrucomicrobiota bacterium]|nr:6-phosphogluconolactonase [Verrucomicrobiota bacterium]HNT15291.1 6-phosphogluconolactonase [Verrucomicrobiota bacterium]